MVAAYRQRVNRYGQFLTHITVRAKHTFLQYLQVRDFDGGLEFNHTKHKLNITVRFPVISAGPGLTLPIAGRHQQRRGPERSGRRGRDAEQKEEVDEVKAWR